MMRYAADVDMIIAAVGDPITDVNQKLYNGHWAISILHRDSAGTLDPLWIDENIRANVIEEDL